MSQYAVTSLLLVTRIRYGIVSLPLVLFQVLLLKHAHILCKFYITTIYALLTCNSDVLRRRFQINSMPGMGNQYTSISHAIRTILSQEGVLGLYKGIVPNLLKVAPSMASSWLSFELTRDFLLSLNPDSEEQL